MAAKPYRVRFEREAEQEFLRAMNFYAAADRQYGQGPILTLAFEAEIDQALAQAARNPRQFPRVGVYRRVLSGLRFRYTIFLKVGDATQTIWVKAVYGPGQNIVRP